MRKKNGSILIYVMMIFAVLMIMGATLSMLTMQNIKNRKHYSESRVNLYYSESGVDVTYGILKEYVKKAADYSTKNTNLEIQIKIDKELERLNNIHEVMETGRMEVDLSSNRIKFFNKEGYPIDPTEGIEILTENEGINEKAEIIPKGMINEKVKLYNENGELNEEVLEAVQELLFKKYYLSYFNMEHNGKKNFMNMIEDIENYLYPNLGTSRTKVMVLNKADYEGVNHEIDGPFTLSVQSTFIKENIEKMIKADFEFQIPKYASKLSFPVKYTNVSMTPVMNKGLVVNKIMEVNGKLKVCGDVYVKGCEEKGIIMKSDKSRLHVQGGSVTACEGVDFNYDYGFDIKKVRSEQGAEINIDSGNLYTKNISFSGEKKSNDDPVDDTKGAQGARLIVSGDMYVHDDLQIDSDYTTVEVNNYFGVSDGSKSEDNKVDNSSSIIINTENVGVDGTKVTIKNKVIIAGTSYIRNLKNPGLSDDYAYQTGESISVKGNYAAYSYPLKNSYNITTDSLVDKDIKYELARTHLSPLTLVTHYDKYSKWFAVYGSGEDKEIIVSFNDGYKDKFKKAKYFKIKDESKVIPLHVKYNVYENFHDRQDFFDDIEAKEQLDIILLDENEFKVGQIKVKNIKNDVEAFLFEKNNEKWIYTELTPRGNFEDSLINVNKYSASSSENQDEKSEFGKFLKVNSTVNINDNITIKCFDKFEDEIKKYNLVVKDYKEISVDSKDKGKIFKDFYLDYGNEKIKGADGISIGKRDESIYSGAILSNGEVRSQNYSGKKELIIRHREDVLKDKRYYMDVFEKRFEGDEDNPYKNKAIEDFEVEVEEVQSKYANMAKTGKTPSNTKDYILTPDSFIKLDKDERENIKKLNDPNEPGLYVNYENNDVLLTNKKDEVVCDGKVFSKDNICRVENYDYGVIVCKGNLYMKGDFTLTGTIIVMGNVFVEEGSEITIIYDEAVVADIIASEEKLTKDIFKEHDEYKGDKVPMVFYSEISKDNSSIPLKINKWVVVK